MLTAVLPSRGAATGTAQGRWEAMRGRQRRNPMYLASWPPLPGHALALGQPVLLGYAAVVWVTVDSSARWHDEPALTRQFGAQYQAYPEHRSRLAATNPAMELEPVKRQRPPPLT